MYGGERRNATKGKEKGQRIRDQGLTKVPGQKVVQKMHRFVLVSPEEDGKREKEGGQPHTSRAFEEKGWLHRGGLARNNLGEM